MLDELYLLARSSWVECRKVKFQFLNIFQIAKSNEGKEWYYYVDRTATQELLEGKRFQINDCEIVIILL